MTDTRPSNSLLPCPHCGREVTLDHIPAHKHTVARFMPDAPDTFVIECACGAGMCGHESEPEVRARWNKRHAHEPGVGTLEYRFNRLLEWLQKRFNVEPNPFSSIAPETWIIEAIESTAQPPCDAQWISVDDRLPHRHTHVWCLNRDGRQFEGCICYGMHAPFFTIPHGDGSPSNTAPAWIDVTHWRALPPTPTKGSAT